MIFIEAGGGIGIWGLHLPNRVEVHFIWVISSGKTIYLTENSPISMCLDESQHKCILQFVLGPLSFLAVRFVHSRRQFAAPPPPYKL